MKPLQKWEQTGGQVHPLHVWSAQLDDRYLVEVQRKDDSLGVLCIFDHDKNDECIFAEETPLYYGAKFGADIDNIGEWQEKCSDFVDNRKTV